MKKVILVLMAVWAAVAAQAYDYKPLVEPGKTWWYRTYNLIYPERMTFDLRICEEVSMNGYEWRMLRLVMADDRNNTIPIDMGYVRQEGAKAYYYPMRDLQAYYSKLTEIDPMLRDVICDVLQMGMDQTYTPAEGALLYDMEAKEGDEFDFYGYTDYIREDGIVVEFQNHYKCNVESVAYDTNCGVERLVQKNKTTCAHFHSGYHTITDGIGIANIECGGLFFIPYLHVMGLPTLWFVYLQGVVDAQEGLLWAANESITEPWDVAGIADAVADGTVRERVSVYTPWGVCVRRDVQREESLSGLPAGVYIVTDGAETRKIAVR